MARVEHTCVRGQTAVRVTLSPPPPIPPPRPYFLFLASLSFFCTRALTDKTMCSSIIRSAAHLRGVVPGDELLHSRRQRDFHARQARGGSYSDGVVC